MIAKKLRLLGFQRWWKTNNGHQPGAQGPHEKSISVKVDTVAIARSMTMAARRTGINNNPSYSGKTWILDLTPIKDIVSDHWSRLSEPVHQFAERVITRHVGNDATITPEGERYILRFTEFHRGDCGEKTRKVAEEIVSHMFGAAGTGSEEMPATRRTPIRSEIRKNGFIQTLLGLVSNALAAFGTNRHLSNEHGGSQEITSESHRIGESGASRTTLAYTNSRPSIPPRPKCDSAANSFPSATTNSPKASANRKAKGSSDPLAQNRNDIKHGPSVVVPPAKSMDFDQSKQPNATRTISSPSSNSELKDSFVAGRASSEVLEIDPEEIKRIEKAMTSRTDEFDRASHDLRKGLDIMLYGVHLNYRPMWNRQNEVVAVYRCVPIRYDDVMGNIADSLVLSRPHDVTQCAILDSLVMHRGAAAVMRFEGEDAGPIPHICIPVHASTLIAAGRLNAFLAEYALLPQGIEKHLIFEVLGAAEYVHQSAMVDAAQKLRGLSRSLVAQLPVEARDLSFWRTAGFGGVSADIRNWNDNEDALIKMMEQFVHLADSAKLTSYIFGTRTLSTTIAAVAAGFSFVGAGSFQADSGPVAIKRYTLSNLYEEFCL